MFGMIQNARISTKLTGAISAALLGLCMMGAIAVFAANTIQDLGADLFVESDHVANVQLSLAVDVERVISEVHAAPSELDLTQLKSKRDRFDSLLAGIREILAQELGRGVDPGMRAASEAIQRQLTLFEAGGKKVFDQSAAFAQPDAIATLNGTVVPAETATQAALKQFHQASDQFDAGKVAGLEATTAGVTRFVIGLAALIVLAVSALAYMVVSRGVVRPLTAFNHVMLRLAGGDTSVTIPFTNRADEIGDIAQAVQVFKINMLEADRLTA